MSLCAATMEFSEQALWVQGLKRAQDAETHDPQP